jgi:hypothetical protein
MRTIFKELPSCPALPETAVDPTRHCRRVTPLTSRRRYRSAALNQPVLDRVSLRRVRHRSDHVIEARAEIPGVARSGGVAAADGH